MKVQRKKLEGFAVGLSIAIVALFSSAAPQAGQRLCTGGCQGCLACGIHVVPLLAWLVWNGKKRTRLLSLLRRAGTTVGALFRNSE